MALEFRTKRARIASAGSVFSRFVGIVAIAATSFVSMSDNALGPVLDQQGAMNYSPSSVAFPTPDPTASAAISQIFLSSSFVGPNRAQKRDRAGVRVDVDELASSFVEARTRLAGLANNPAPGDPDPELTSHNLMLKSEDAPVLLAAVDPALASAALAAIAKATPDDPSIPRPGVISDQLAYARASTPATERTVNAYSERERWCLSSAIYFEARGESYRGQVAVAQVVMNRVENRLYPETICGVVFQDQSQRNRCQFSFACDGIRERVTDQKAWAQADEIAHKVTAGEIFLPEVANAINYHAAYVYPAWAPRMQRLTRIGAHIFYRFRG